MLEKRCNDGTIGNGGYVKEWGGIRSSILAILKSHQCTYSEAIDILQEICRDLKYNGEILLKETKISDIKLQTCAKSIINSEMVSSTTLGF